MIVPAGGTVLVTGAAGGIGRVVVAVLAGAGLRVVAADRVPADGDRVLVGDTCDPAFVADCVRGTGRAVDAVVHLAAIAAPGQRPDDVTLVDNVRGAYLVLDAAGRAGVRTAVVASSVAAYGYAWADRDLSPPYVPVDEEQPLVPIDPYGLSKLVTEQVAASATRRWGIATTLLRFPFVGTGERLAKRLAEVRADPAANRRELWSWLDTRDAAGAVLAALTCGITGHHAINVAAPDTASGVPTAELLARHHPTTHVRSALGEHATLLDTTAARVLLGFAPDHGWR